MPRDSSFCWIFSSLDSLSQRQWIYPWKNQHLNGMLQDAVPASTRRNIIIRAQIQLMNLDWIKRSAWACWQILFSKVVFLCKLFPCFKWIFSLPSHRSLSSPKPITTTSGVTSIPLLVNDTIWGWYSWLGCRLIIFCAVCGPVLTPQMPWVPFHIFLY